MFLVSCGKTSVDKKELDLKISHYVLTINNDFYVASNKADINNVDIIYTYKKKKSKNKFSDSLIIGKYLGGYPKDEKEFFSIIIDKLKKQIVGSKILDKGNIKIDGNNLFYIKYKVDENLFGGTKENIYYGLQAYLLDKKNNEIYIISYISLEEGSVNDIFKKVKDLKINK